jgi:hypothetical protein
VDTAALEGAAAVVAPNGSVYMFGGWERSQTAAQAAAAAEGEPLFPVMPVR